MRRGISLLEVLFSMLLVTIGLFGAIALLPVAAQQAKRGRTADAQAVAGESAVNEVSLREMHNAAKWYPPVANFFRANLVDGTGNPVTDANSNPITARFFPGFGYCIDPLFVTSQGNAVVTKQGNGSSRYFPYYDPTAPATISAAGVRMERISLVSGMASPAAMTLQHAMSIFVSDDDLFTDRVKDVSVPASQVYTRLGTTTNLRRLSTGELSWFVTLAPKDKANLTTAPEEYTMSVVVAQNRPLTTLTVETDDASIVAGERLLDVASFPGSGVGGGEVVVRFRSGRTEKDLEIFPGDWMMLSGSYSVPLINQANYIDLPLLSSGYSGTWRWEYYNTPDNQLSAPRDRHPVFGWYRVVSTGAELVPATTDQKEITLSGSDWPAALTTSNVTQATIVSGVVAVYERTVQIKYPSR